MYTTVEPIMIIVDINKEARIEIKPRVSKHMQDCIGNDLHHKHDNFRVEPSGHTMELVEEVLKSFSDDDLQSDLAKMHKFYSCDARKKQDQKREKAYEDEKKQEYPVLDPPPRIPEDDFVSNIEWEISQEMDSDGVEIAMVPHDEFVHCYKKEEVSIRYEVPIDIYRDHDGVYYG